MNPNETVIVIRSLVPGGVAQLDGQLIPGDRLVFVNDTNLENASLDQAVQALKGAPKGVVRIGVAKPLPIPDSVSHCQVSEETRSSQMISHEFYTDQTDKNGPVNQESSNGDEGGSPTQNVLMKSESF
ncbi:hypothetical protein RUM43_004175 [Polyplax serrata]|uniref:PDZ domain-containing protein n=1 Tax=Polyplax serrata TaxID=468196 RepID=A0AAN8SAM5_POLSC